MAVTITATAVMSTFPPAPRSHRKGHPLTTQLEQQPRESAANWLAFLLGKQRRRPPGRGRGGWAGMGPLCHQNILCGRTEGMGGPRSEGSEGSCCCGPGESRLGGCSDFQDYFLSVSVSSLQDGPVSQSQFLLLC